MLSHSLTISGKFYNLLDIYIYNMYNLNKKVKK